jgi:hypothetical protein
LTGLGPSNRSPLLKAITEEECAHQVQPEGPQPDGGDPITVRRKITFRKRR